MVFESLVHLLESFLAFIGKLGYLGIFIGMIFESSVFPIPSEIILIPAGTLIERGEMEFLPVLIAGLGGALTGAIINYCLAFLIGRRASKALIKKYEKFLFINQEKLDKVDKFFKSHGQITIFTGRLIPVVRQLISFPAGFSKMNLVKFVIFTILGATIWQIFLISIGYFFSSDYDAVYKNAAVIVILSAIIFFVLYLIIKKKSHK